MKRPVYHREVKGRFYGQRKKFEDIIKFMQSVWFNLNNSLNTSINILFNHLFKAGSELEIKGSNLEVYSTLYSYLY